MNGIELTGPIVGVLCTISMLIGFLSGHRETRLDMEIIDAEGWHQHVQSALWVARRAPGPDYEETAERQP